MNEAITNTLLNLWKHPFVKFIFKNLIFIIIVGCLIFFGELKANDIVEPWLRYMFYIFFAVIGSIWILFYKILRRFEFMKEGLEDKIYRKLVNTNAIIPNRADKLAITARDIGFYKETDFNKLGNYKCGESIDIVRTFSYQNLILTPRYINYLFYSRPKNKIKIAVVEEMCQATMCYLLLCILSGYNTFIIKNRDFKEFMNKKNQHPIDIIKVIKGNPFLMKQENDVIFGGYTDFRDNEKAKKIPEILTNQCWNVLTNLKSIAWNIKKEDVYDLSIMTKKLDEKFR